MIDESEKLNITLNRATTINRRRLATTRDYSSSNMINILIDKTHLLATIVTFRIDRIEAFNFFFNFVRLISKLTIISIHNNARFTKAIKINFATVKSSRSTQVKLITISSTTQINSQTFSNNNRFYQLLNFDFKLQSIKQTLQKNTISIVNRWSHLTILEIFKKHIKLTWKKLSTTTRTTKHKSRIYIMKKTLIDKQTKSTIARISRITTIIWNKTVTVSPSEALTGQKGRRSDGPKDRRHIELRSVYVLDLHTWYFSQYHIDPTSGPSHNIKYPKGPLFFDRPHPL